MPASLAIISMDPFSKPEEQNTFRADSTIVSIRCSFEGRCIFVTLAMLKEVCAPVFESMDSRQYATEMNLAQLSTSGRRIQLELINSFVYCFETKYSYSLQRTFALYKSLLLRLAHYFRLTHLI
jgi:hypothetical protein